MISLFKVTKSFFEVFLFPKSNIEQIARISLIEKSSFRLPQKSNEDILIGLKVLKDCFIRFYSSIVPYKPINIEGEFLILESNLKFYYQDLKYYETLNKKPYAYAVKQDLIGYKIGILPFYFFMLTFGFVIAILPIFFLKRKKNCALLIPYILEISGLLNLLEENQIKQVNDHVQFEADSNFLFIILKKLNIIHNKLPSASPLKTHNKNLLCDTLYVNNPYHEEEVLLYSSTIKFNKLKKWPPENSFLFIHNYLEKNISPTKRLGFYSHGSWIRKINGLASDGLDIFDSETKLLKILSEIKNKEIEIFLHPKEKKDKFSSIKYFHSYSEKFSFNYSESISHFEFSKIDIGVGALSTILFERLFAGYKTLFFRSEKDDFPRKDSALFHISFSNSKEFENLISIISRMTNKEFFSNYKLDGYAWWSFDFGFEKQ